MPDLPLSIGDVRAAAARELDAVSDSPDLDAELLLRSVLGVDRAGLFLRAREPLPPGTEEPFWELVERRLTGEPVAYILGRKGFREIELVVDPRVLVPRPETEELVEHALGWLRQRSGPRHVVDVGTGSGAIALSLAVELGDRDDVEIIATDVSSAALEVAAVNRNRLGLDTRVKLVRTYLLSGLQGPFDLILANLPYLRPDQRHPSTRSEPDLALYAGDDGFALYRELFTRVPGVLADDGLVIIEIDPSQAGIGGGYIARTTGLPVAIVKDGAGRNRFLMVGARA